MSRPASDDSGFSLLEVLISIVVIGTVMTAVAPFLVQSLALTSRQRSAQVGIQVANDALERVRALDSSSLLTGRSKLAVADQWNAAPAILRTHLAGMAQASDPQLLDTAPAADYGSKAPLPTVPYLVTMNGVGYSQSWYVGYCWQAKVLSAQPAIGDCTPTVTLVPFYRVLVAVTWPHRQCPAGTCLYVASTLLSRGADPVFDIKQAPPTLTNPGNQSGYLATAVDLQIVSAGGRPPLTWAATRLPTGLTMSVGGRITGTPTVADSYPVVVKVTDRDGRTDDAGFTWTIVATPVLTSPGDQLSRTNETAVNLSVPLTGGLAPLAWTVSGLPTGLRFDAATGIISGTPTATAQTVTTRVTVTDSGKPARTASVSFNWRVLTPVSIQDVGTQTLANNTNIGSFTPPASGGQKPYKWRAQGLPEDLVINATTGAITGYVRHGTRYIATVWAMDDLGDEALLTVVCNVTPSSTSDLRVTVPTPSNPNQSSTVNRAITSFTATASGATPSNYTWTATGLPPGLRISTAGVVSGTPSAQGTYRVQINVASSNSTEANMMFTWTVT